MFKKLLKWFKRFFTKKPPKRVYGWKRDKVDHRDKVFKLSAPVEVPSKIDLSIIMSPAYDQKSVGSCTGNSIAAAIEYNQIKQFKEYDFISSRLFIYYNERDMEGTIMEDCGATIRDGIKVVNVFGVCKETFWPYDETKWMIKPTEAAYNEAILHRSIDYSRLNNTNLNELKACLASGFPFVFGFQVYESFERPETARSGIQSIPKPGEACCGGHAVAAFGYDDEKQAFLIRNSWSPKWGINGYFWMPYSYITNPLLASDFWVIKSITPHD
jgi:C1A family cysteine protease